MAMERYYQTVMVSLLTAGIIATITFLWNLNASVSRFDERLGAATVALQTLANTAETKAEHDRDMAIARDILADHEGRVRKLELTTRVP